MGSDKGLLEKNGLPWCMRAREKLLPFCRKVFISISSPQYPAYSRVVDPAHLVTDDPMAGSNAGGPMIAAVSAARKFPEQDLWILACDLTDMAPAILGELVSAYYTHPEFRCYAFTSAQGFEPLCAIYRAAALHSLNSPTPDTPASLQQLLHRERTCPLVIPDGYHASFRNRNHPTD